MLVEEFVHQRINDRGRICSDHLMNEADVMVGFCRVFREMEEPNGIQSGFLIGLRASLHLMSFRWSDHPDFPSVVP